MADGSWRSIENIKVDDRVTARDQSDPDGDLHSETVTAVLAGSATSIVELTVADARGRTSKIQTTLDHPFWMMDTGWTAAKNLYPGACLRGGEGQMKVIELTNAPGERQVFNLAVEGARTYLVGAISERGPPQTLWVHNDCVLRQWLEEQVRRRAAKLSITLSEQQLLKAIEELAKRHLNGEGRALLVARGEATISDANIRRVVTAVVRGDERLFYTTEGLATSGRRLASQVYELKCPHAIEGKLADGSRVRLVPALKYENPAGRDFVKFDAVDPERAFVLIDRKLNIGAFENALGRTVLKSSQARAFERQAKALRDSNNTAYRIRYEVPSQYIADRMRVAITGIMPDGRFEIVVVP